MWNKDIDKLTEKQINFLIRRTRSSLMLVVTRGLRQFDMIIKRKTYVNYRRKENAKRLKDDRKKTNLPFKTRS